MREPGSGGGARRQVRALLAALLAVLMVVLAPPSAAVAQEPSQPCAAQGRSAEDLNAAVEAHNAKPHEFTVPRESAAAAAYDAEAAQLDSRRTTVATALQKCVDVWLALAADELNSPALQVGPSPRLLSRLEDARSKVPPSYRDPPPAPGESWAVPRGSPLRPIYDVLRDESPSGKLRQLDDLRLQGQPRPQVGDRDQSQPDRRIVGRASPGGQVRSVIQIDHIVPLAEIVEMTDFAQLTPGEMYAVVNTPLNLQWLLPSTNARKQSRSVGAVLDVDPEWQRRQVALENSTRTKLINAIQQLIESHG